MSEESIIISGLDYYLRHFGRQVPFDFEIWFLISSRSIQSFPLLGEYQKKKLLCPRVYKREFLAQSEDEDRKLEF